ncbi:SAF domain-containing protein [Planotetraspora thailandica]|nr:SAF domain-containing protein [Planotetraspora thailandica]
MKVRRLLARHRRVIAALLAGVAVACALAAVRQPQGVAVLVAARDLVGGRLSAADVTTVRLPPGAVPDGALPTNTAVAGRVLAGPMRRGEPLTDARLLGQGPLTTGEPGKVAVPVRIADADAARLLSSGDVIDVLAAFEGPVVEGSVDDAAGVPAGSGAVRAVTVAHGVRVMSSPPTEAADDGALLVLATSSAEAAQLAQAQAHARLSVAIHPR